MKFFFLFSSVFSLDLYQTENFHALFKEKIYPDVLRVGEKPAEYFSLPSSESLAQFAKCVNDFLNERWSAADLCLYELKYRVIQVSLADTDETIYGYLFIKSKYS